MSSHASPDQYRNASRVAAQAAHRGIEQVERAYRLALRHLQPDSKAAVELRALMESGMRELGTARELMVVLAGQ